MKKEEFMKLAIDKSKDGMDNNFGGPFGAIIVKNNKVLTEGFNIVTSSNDPTAHAEINVIRKACEKLKTFSLEGCELYTSCEPCPMCLSAIYWARIKKVYYANTKEDADAIDFSDKFIYEELSRYKKNRKLEMEQICREDAIKVFDNWSKKTDKIEY